MHVKTVYRVVLRGFTFSDERGWFESIIGGQFMKNVILHESLVDVYFPNKELKKEHDNAKIVAYKYYDMVFIIKRPAMVPHKMSIEEFMDKYFIEMI